LGRKLEGATLADALHDSIALCQLINVIRPNAIAEFHYDAESIPDFMAMENIGLFVEACRESGVPESALFHTIDLFEEKDINQVLTCLLHLKQLSQTSTNRLQKGNSSSFYEDKTKDRSKMEGYRVVGGREDSVKKQEKKFPAERVRWRRAIDWLIKWTTMFPLAEFVIEPMITAISLGFASRVAVGFFSAMSAKNAKRRS